MTSENEKSQNVSLDRTVNGHSNYHSRRGMGKWRASQGNQYTPYRNNYYERTRYSWNNNNRGSNSRSFNRSNRYNIGTPSEKNKPLNHNGNNDSNISFNENDIISSTAYKSKSPKKRNKNFLQDRQSNCNKPFSLAENSQSFNSFKSDRLSAKSPSATKSQKDKISEKQDIKRKQIAKKDSKVSCTKTNSKDVAKNKEKTKKDKILKRKRNSQAKKNEKVNKNLPKNVKSHIEADNFFVIDSEAPIGNVANDIHIRRDYIRKAHLKFPDTKSPHSNISIAVPSKVSQVKNVIKSQNKVLQNQNSNIEKFVSNTTFKLKKNEILGNEMEIYEKLETEYSSYNSLCNDSLTNLELLPSKGLKIPQIFTLKGSININENPITQRQSPDKYSTVNKIPEVLQRENVNVNEGLLAPPTRSQSPSPSPSIPCGQQHTISNMVDFSPKKEMETDREHCLANFFSQMSPLTLSQESIRELQSSSNDQSVSPNGEGNVIINEQKQNKLEMIALSPIVYQTQSITAKESKSKSDMSVSGSMLTHSDEDIIDSSQTTSSSVLLDVNSLRNLSINISRKTPTLSVSQPLRNSSLSLQEDISFLKSHTPPVTSTQVSSRIKKISLPDISPLISKRPNIPAFVNNANEQPQQLNSEVDSQPVSLSPLQNQEMCTQPFKIDDDNLLKHSGSIIDSSVNSIATVNSCTRDYEYFKIKMESLFDIPDSQCSVDEFSKMENEEAISSKKDLIPESQDKEEEDKEEILLDIESGAAENQYTNEVIADDVSQNIVSLEEENGTSDKDKNQEKNVIKIIEIEETQESISKDEEQEKFVLNTKGCNYLSNVNETHIAAEMEQNESSVLVDKCDTDLDKENQNPGSPNGYIDMYDSKVEEVVRKFRDLCEKKKRKFLKNKKPIRFSIKFKDQAKGVIVSKEVIEFVLMEDDNQEDVKSTLSVTIGSTSGIGKHDSNCHSMKSFPVDRHEEEDIKECDDERKEKKRKKKCLDESPEILLRWWDGYTKDIPASIFRSNKETRKETFNNSENSPSDVRTSLSPEPRKLDEERDDEESYQYKKKLKKSKRNKRLKDKDEEASSELESVPEASSSCQKIENTEDEIKIKRNKKKLGKERKKKQKINYNESKTPPFEFKKLECQPGKKRQLLNNCDDNYLLNT